MSKRLTYFLYGTVALIYTLFAFELYNYRGTADKFPRLFQSGSKIERQIRVSKGSSRVERIFNNLNRNVGLRVRLEVVQDSSINASAGGRTITVTTGLLRTSDNEVAFVLGHEMAHLAYGAGEAGADMGAIRILKMSGTYSACRGGMAVFERLRRAHGEQGEDEHPRNSDRIAMVKKYACGR